MYKKLAILFGALLIAAVGAVITAYLFAGRGKSRTFYEDDMLFI